MEQIYTLFCSFPLFILDCWMFNVINSSLFNKNFVKYSRIFKDAGKYSRTTRCFSRIKDKTRFDSKFKDNSWRSRTSGNLNLDWVLKIQDWISTAKYDSPLISATYCTSVTEPLGNIVPCDKKTYSTNVVFNPTRSLSTQANHLGFTKPSNYLCGGLEMAQHENKWSPLDGAHE